MAMHLLRHRTIILIILQNPKYIENLAGVVRAAACFEDYNVIWTGSRIKEAQFRSMKGLSAGHYCSKKEHTMREFRHKDYQSVVLSHSERPFDLIGNCIPVCVEFDGTEDLSTFEHPANAAYVFGPEDGSVSTAFKVLCHRFVRIPSKYCLNLAATVNIVLADRTMKCVSKCGKYHQYDIPENAPWRAIAF